MPRYLSCLPVDSVALGLGAAAQLTRSGTNNVFMGVGAGRSVTTGSGNIIVGNAAGTAAMSGQIVLSTGSDGTVRAQWDSAGNMQLVVRDNALVPDPAPGFLTVGYDTTKQLLVFRHHDGTAVRTSTFTTSGDVVLTVASTALVNAVSLVANPTTRSLRSLVAGTNITLDGATDAGAVVIHAAAASLADATTTGVSLIRDAAARSLRRLDVAQSTPLVLDGTTDPTRILLGLPHLASTTTALLLGAGGAVRASPGVNDVAVGPAALAAAGTGGANVAVGGSVLANTTGGAGNTGVGNKAGVANRAGSNNTALGNHAGPANETAPSDATGLVTVGFRAGMNVTTGADNNTLVGHQAGMAVTTGAGNTAVGQGALAAATTGARNVCVGLGAGASITTGTGNAILGSHAGTAGLTNALVLADGTGTVRARWDNANNGVFGVDATVPSLSTDNTMSLYYNAASQGFNVALRIGGQTYTVEVSNERQVNATSIAASTTLAAGHRNRFTQITATAVITVVAYTGIVVGAEHEFMNNSASAVSFVAGSGVTIRSVASKLNISSYGVGVLKYLGSSVFLLCGSIE